MDSKFNIGDCVFIKSYTGDKIVKKIEGIAYTKDKVYYITDAVDLAILGYDENDIMINERAQMEEHIKNNIKILNDIIFDEQMKLLIIQNDLVKISV
jgi:uncharacterized cupredoxin-like copper-binding protein